MLSRVSRLAAMSAPSGRDRRPWEFVVVTERPALDSLAAALPYAKMLTAAPCAIVVCGAPECQSYWYLDCSAAAQNVLLAAQSLGLGAVWTAAYPYEERMSAVRSPASRAALTACSMASASLGISRL